MKDGTQEVVASPIAAVSAAAAAAKPTGTDAPPIKDGKQEIVTPSGAAAAPANSNSNSNSNGNGRSSRRPAAVPPQDAQKAKYGYDRASRAAFMKAQEEAGKEATIVMAQLGGGKSSNAGDSLVISPHRSRRSHTIDLGEDKSKKGKTSKGKARKSKGRKDDAYTAETLSEAQRHFRAVRAAHDPTEEDSDFEDDTGNKHAPLKTLAITHDHADHAGAVQDWEDFDEVTVGESAPADLGLHAASIRKVSAANNRLFGYRQRAGKVKPGNPQLSVSGTAILPVPDNKKPRPADENARSLGALIKVEQQTVGGPKSRTFTFLSLGDMTNHEGKPGVDQALKDDGNHPLDLVKLAHHGSENNLDVMPWEQITKNTRILISGYTMTTAKPLADKLSQRDHGEVYFLFQSKAIADQFMNLETWKSTLNGKKDKAKINARVARDYILVVKEDGSIVGESYGWD